MNAIPLRKKEKSMTAVSTSEFLYPGHVGMAMPLEK